MGFKEFSIEDLLNEYHPITLTFTLDDEEDLRILRFRERDLYYNIKLAEKNKVKLFTNIEKFSRGRYFYLCFKDTSRIYDLGFRGKWLS